MYNYGKLIMCQMRLQDRSWLYVMTRSDDCAFIRCQIPLYSSLLKWQLVYFVQDNWMFRHISWMNPWAIDIEVKVKYLHSVTSRCSIHKASLHKNLGTGVATCRQDLLLLINCSTTVTAIEDRITFTCLRLSRYRINFTYFFASYTIVIDSPASSRH